MTTDDRTTPRLAVTLLPPPADTERDATSILDVPSGPDAGSGQRDRPSLTMLAGDRPGRLIPLGADGLVIGRSTEAGAQLADADLSRRHARFFCVDGRYHVEDLGSTNGTFVGGRKLDGPVALRDGDHIQLGPNRLLRFNLDSAEGEDAAIQLYEASVRDPTSGAYDRRHFEAGLRVESDFSRHHGVPLTLLLLDVDDFKRINDVHGHSVGDAVLRVLCASVQLLLKPTDALVRYGGDEFAVLCRDTTPRNGFILAERIRANIESLVFGSRGNEFHVTVSIGVASRRSDESDRISLVEAADRAVYKAKAEGRNTVAAQRKRRPKALA